MSILINSRCYGYECMKQNFKATSGLPFFQASDNGLYVAQ